MRSVPLRVWPALVVLAMLCLPMFAHPSPRVSALSGIAEAQARAGDARGAAETVAEAQSIVRTMDRASHRALALSGVAKAQVEAENVRSAPGAGANPTAQLDGADVRPEPNARPAMGAVATGDSTTATPTYESGQKGKATGRGAWGAFLFGFGGDMEPERVYALTWNAESSEAAFSKLMKTCREIAGAACWPRYLSSHGIWFPDHVILFSSEASMKVISERDDVFQVRARCGLVYKDNCPNCRYHFITGTSANDVETRYQRKVAQDREYYGQNYRPDMHRKIAQRCNDS